MTREEKRIREDILNEIEIPNILDKVKPYANEKAAILQEDKKTVRLNFHRPARIFAASLACVIGVMIVFIVGISLNGGSLDSRTSKSSIMDGRYDYGGSGDANESAASEPTTPNQGEAAPMNQMSDDEFATYCENEQIGPQDKTELTELLNEIKAYVEEGKSVDEIIAIYNAQDERISEDFIRMAYNHFSN